MLSRPRPVSVRFVALTTFILLVFTEVPARAYLDPGSGSLMLQMAIGAVAGFLAIIKIYWVRIRGVFSSKKSGDVKPEQKP